MSLYTCSNCDAQFPKWQGRCTECGKWGTIDGSEEASKKSTAPPSSVVSFDNIKVTDHHRLKTGIEEIDRVLGGGVVSGSLILLGGEPGIGKSTLVLHISEAIKGSVLYVSGEESAQQIKTRVDRLNVNTSNLSFANETSIEAIVATIEKEKPTLAIIDSIQTIHSQESPTGAGSVAQVRVCTTKLLEVAKKHNVSVLIIGHVTKGGEVAGPKTLEHLVDVVLYLEGEQYHALRILRGVKNRFGNTAEIGIFEMTGGGLKELQNPSRIFLNDTKDSPGSIITATTEGSRVFLLEVQALVNQAAAGYPQRKSQGFDQNRLQMLAATMDRRLDTKLATHDIYLNLVGGLKVQEPAIDLAVCLALYTALKNKTLSSDTVAFGEVGLTGEVRVASNMAKRISEAEKIGFKKIIIPKTTTKIASKKIELLPVATLQEAIKVIE